MIDLAHQLGGEDKCQFICADVRDKEDLENALSGLPDAFKSIDVLINNAGVTEDSLFLRMDLQKWQNVLDDRETHYIEDMLTFANHIVIQSRFDGIPIIEILDINSNKLSEIKMNDEVYDLGLAYNNDFNSSFFRYSYSSLKTTPQIYKYDLYDNENKVVWKKQVNNFIDTNYEVKRITLH